MKKYLRLPTIFLLMLLVGALLCTAVSATGPQRYDPAQEGVVSEYYKVDTQKGYISGIAPGTTTKKLQSACAPTQLSISGEKVVTGTKISFFVEQTPVVPPEETPEEPPVETPDETPDEVPEGTTEDVPAETLAPVSVSRREISLTAIVTGDLNSDGDITISDMLLQKSYLLGSKLSATAVAAGDLTGEGDLTITDFLKVKSYLLGLEKVEATYTKGNLFLLTPGSSASWDVTNAASYITYDDTLLSVENGTVTALQKEGSGFIYALDAEGNILKRQLVTVLNDPVTISFNETKLTLSMGQSKKLTPVFNHPVSPEVTWKSSDTSVLTVKGGKITTVGYGKAKVTATLPNGKKASVTVTVAPPITDIAIERTLYKVKPGKTKSLNLLLTPANSGEEIIWTSSDPAIATVSADGTVTGVAYGTVTITAKGKYSGLSAKCKVKVCDVIQVAVTFDDGPSNNTATLLDFLKKNDIRVTFFMVGNRINSFKNTVKREAAEGHELGYHSYAHAMQPQLSSQQITSDFKKSDKMLYELTGKHFTVWRTPGGDFNSRVLSCVPAPHIMWSVDTLDWKSRDAYSVRSAILRAKDGDIVLLHDLYSSTVSGAIMAMEQMQKGNYEFLTVTELLSRDGKAPENGKTYYSDR